MSTPDLPQHTALLAGATGLVGAEVLRRLLADPDYARVGILVRRPTGIGAPKLDQRVVDFDRLGAAEFPAAEHVFCCLGTTIRAAGGQEAFRRVDFDYVLAVARRALDGGATTFAVVSALGASARSGVFYNRVKGELEEALRALPYRSVVVLRPSLLAGPRAEHRPGERIALAVLGPLGRILPARYRPVDFRRVARALIDCAKQARPGFRVVESEQIQRFEPGD